MGPSLSFLFALMRIRILFFAAYRERMGTGELLLELPEPATVGELLHAIRSLGEPFLYLPGAPVVAVNRRFASLQTALQDEDEVALVPPMAGG